MPEVVLNLPILQRNQRHRSTYHDLFTRISDGQVWKVSPAEYRLMRNKESFRAALLRWARRRGLKAVTRTVDNCVYVQITPEVATE